MDMAVDAGLVVNPEAARAQFEGAAVFGTSVARSGEITAKDGAIEQSNFFIIRSPGLTRLPIRPMSILSTATLHRLGSASPVSHLSFRRCAMQSTPQLESGFASSAHKHESRKK